MRYRLLVTYKDDGAEIIFQMKEWWRVSWFDCGARKQFPTVSAADLCIHRLPHKYYGKVKYIDKRTK